MREVSEKFPQPVEKNLQSSRVPQTLARSCPRAGADGFDKIAWHSFFVFPNGTCRIGESCFLW